MQPGGGTWTRRAAGAERRWRMSDNATGQSIYDELSRIADALLDCSMEVRSAGPRARRAIADGVILFAAGRFSRAQMKAINRAGECVTAALNERLDGTRAAGQSRRA